MMPSSCQESSEDCTEENVDFENLLERVGGYGKFQKRLVWLMVIPLSIVNPLQSQSPIFMMSSPDHRCYDPYLASVQNLSTKDKQALIGPEEKDSDLLHHSCNMYNVSYREIFQDVSITGVNLSSYVSAHSGNWTLVPCKQGWEFDKSEYKRTVTTDWNLVCENHYLPSLMFTLAIAGSAVGTPIFGALSDKFGRKKIFFVSSIMYLISSVFIVTLPTFAGFITAKTINTLPFNAVYQLSSLVALEIVSPEVRTRMNALINFAWSAGLSLLPLVAWLTADWIWLAWISVITSLPLIVYIWVLPESPRWLITQNKFEEANEVFEKIARVNGKDISHIDMVALLQKCSLKENGTDGNCEDRSGLEIFRKPTLLKRFAFLTLCWAAGNIAFSSFHINVSSLYGNEFLNFFLLALVEVPSYLLTWYMVDSKLGRRWTNVIFLFLIAFVCFLPLFGSKDVPVFYTVASLVGKFGVAGNVMVLYQQCIEIYPTQLRSSGISLTSTIASILSIIAPNIVYLKRYGRHIPYTIIAVICLFAGSCGFFIPETLNENLPQTLDDAENFGKNRPFFSWAITKPSSLSTRLKEDSSESVNSVSLKTMVHDPQVEGKRDSL